MNGDIRHDHVIFEGRWNYRKPAQLMFGLALLFLGLFAVLGAIFMVMSVQPSSGGFWAGLLVVVAIVCFAVGLSILSAYARSSVDRLVVSSAGVSYGEQHWLWDRIVAFRISLFTPNSDARCIRIWIDRERGSGKFLLFDDGLSPWEYQEVLDRVMNYCPDAGIEVLGH